MCSGHFLSEDWEVQESKVVSFTEVAPVTMVTHGVQHMSHRELLVLFLLITLVVGIALTSCADTLAEPATYRVINNRKKVPSSILLWRPRFFKKYIFGFKNTQFLGRIKCIKETEFLKCRLKGDYLLFLPLSENYANCIFLVTRKCL